MASIKEIQNKQTIICAECNLLASASDTSFYGRVTFDDGITIYLCPKCLEKALEKNADKS